MIGHEASLRTTYLPSFLARTCKPSVIATGSDASDNIFPDYMKIKHLANSTGAELTVTIIKFIFNYDIFNLKVTTPPNIKLNKLRDCIGLNITELATMLSVKRPTIYEWLDTNGNPSANNKKRIDNIYNLLDPLISNNAIEFKKYLYNETENGERLYDLLISANLDSYRISILIQEIVEDILSKRNKAFTHEEMLIRKGFNPVSKEQKNKALNRLIRKIG